jgi:hypothetical protein
VETIRKSIILSIIHFGEERFKPSPINPLAAIFVLLDTPKWEPRGTAHIRSFSIYYAGSHHIKKDIVSLRIGAAECTQVRIVFFNILRLHLKHCKLFDVAVAVSLPAE